MSKVIAMPDAPHLAATASTTQPVSFRPPWAAAADISEGRGMDAGLGGDIHPLSIAQIATIVGLAVLCWAPIAATLIVLLH